MKSTQPISRNTKGRQQQARRRFNGNQSIVQSSSGVNTANSVIPEGPVVAKVLIRGKGSNKETSLSPIKHNPEGIRLSVSMGSQAVDSTRLASERCYSSGTQSISSQLEDPATAINRFILERKDFDKSITYYNDFLRGKLGCTDNKEYVEVKTKIKDTEYKKMEKRVELEGFSRGASLINRGTYLKDINELNNDLLRLKQRKDELKKTNPYPSASFGYKIAHNEKVDIEKYWNKIKKIKESISKSDPKKSREATLISDSEIPQKTIPNYDLKKLENIQKRFTRVTQFMKEYSGLLKEITRHVTKNPDKVSSVLNLDIKKQQMKKLEQKEITASIRDEQDLSEKLGISEYSSYNYKEKSIQDVLRILGGEHIKGHPKISNLTTPNSVFLEGCGLRKKQPNIYYSCNMTTPFGKVEVDAYDNGNLMIRPEKSTVAPTYDAMAYNLDKLFENNKKDKIIDEVINPIINYLRLTTLYGVKRSISGRDLLKKVDESLGDITTSSSGSDIKMDEQQKKSAATLCGVLFLSESRQFRNPTLGKFERSSIKRVRQLINLGIKNPFSKVYANSSGEYINAHDKSSDGASWLDGDNRKALSDGGHKQARQLLRYKLVSKDNKVINDYSVDDFSIAVNLADLPLVIQNKENKRKDKKLITSEKQPYIKIEDLSDDKIYDDISYEEGRKVSAREFVERQINRNMRDLYKMLNRTPKKPPKKAEDK